MNLSDSLKWRVGNWVEVRPPEEILATLDESGSLEALPFMPEMLRHCGGRFQIVKAAHKTCDPTGATNLRRMENAVHLETRCDGGRHGGCQAGCLFFWKTAWLKPVDGPEAKPAPWETPQAYLALERGTLAAPAADGEVRYRCQATEIMRATSWQSPIRPMQFVQDLLSGNVTAKEFIRYVPLSIAKTLNMMLRRLKARSAQGAMRPSPTPKTGGTPLDLKAGDVVQVRPQGEIQRTLNNDNKNFGLSFDSDMRQYCGTEHKVLRRIEHIIDEKTGKMLNISRDCIILDGAICTGLDCRNRLFCSRGAFMYWREAWLKKTG